MGRTPLSMLLMSWTLKRAGFRVRNWGYSSYTHTIAQLGLKLQADLQKRRWALTEGAPPQGVGRVVMLAPPNRGARRADRATRWVAWLLNPLAEIRTDAQSTVRRLGEPAGVQIGVIAGERDGKVALAETHLAGETDHVTVPSAHTFIMLRGDVRRLTLAFLRHGRFASDQNV